MTIGTGGEASLSGFSSRSTSQTLTQFPQRDEAHMEPGFSNSKASAKAEAAPVDEKVLDTATVEDKAVKPAKKSARKKS